MQYSENAQHPLFREPPALEMQKQGQPVGHPSDAQNAAELWTAEQVGKFLKVSRKAVYAMVLRRQIPFVKIGYRVRFFPEEIRQWVAAQRSAPFDKGP